MMYVKKYAKQDNTILTTAKTGAVFNLFRKDYISLVSNINTFCVLTLLYLISHMFALAMWDNSIANTINISGYLLSKNGSIPRSGFVSFTVWYYVIIALVIVGTVVNSRLKKVIQREKELRI